MWRYATHSNILRLLDICTSTFNATSTESVTIHYSLTQTPWRDRSLCSRTERHGQSLQYKLEVYKWGGVIKCRLFIYHISIIYNNILKSVVQSADSGSESQSQAAAPLRLLTHRMIHSDLSPRLDTDSQAQMLELTLPIWPFIVLTQQDVKIPASQPYQIILLPLLLKLVQILLKR